MNVQQREIGSRPQSESPSYQAFFNAVRLDCYIGTELQRGHGTGFFYAYPAGEGNEKVVLVTAAHVVKGNTSVKFRMAQRDNLGRPDTAEPVWFQLDGADWLYHPDNSVDLAIAPIGRFLNMHFGQGRAPLPMVWREQGLLRNDFLSETRWIEELYIIGCPAGSFDDVNLLPVVRKVTTATPIHVDYKGRREFLIDGHMYKGSSGSPVVLINEGLVLLPGGVGIVGETRTGLFGILSEVLLDHDHTEVGLGRCIKADRLQEFLPQLNARENFGVVL